MLCEFDLALALVLCRLGERMHATTRSFRLVRMPFLFVGRVEAVRCAPAGAVLLCPCVRVPRRLSVRFRLRAEAAVTPAAAPFPLPARLARVLGERLTRARQRSAIEQLPALVFMFAGSCSRSASGTSVT
eukprot:Amastigsp_a1719_104.p6 type:complete len:130 gc:universal Amastigsp_a1719_104:419-808(+)